MEMKNDNPYISRKDKNGSLAKKLSSLITGLPWSTIAEIKTTMNGTRWSQYCHLNLIFSVVRNFTYRYNKGPYVKGINTNSYNGRIVSFTSAKIISNAIKNSHVARIRSAINGFRLVAIISPAKMDWVIPMYKISFNWIQLQVTGSVSQQNFSPYICSGAVL